MTSDVDLSAATWRTSSYSNGDGGNCVEVAEGLPHTVPVRDSKRAAGPTLAFPSASWASFVAALRNDRFTG